MTKLIFGDNKNTIFPVIFIVFVKLTYATSIILLYITVMVNKCKEINKNLILELFEAFFLINLTLIC